MDLSNGLKDYVVAFALDNLPRNAKSERPHHRRPRWWLVGKSHGVVNTVNLFRWKADRDQMIADVFRASEIRKNISIKPSNQRRFPLGRPIVLHGNDVLTAENSRRHCDGSIATMNHEIRRKFLIDLHKLRARLWKVSKRIKRPAPLADIDPTQFDQLMCHANTPEFGSEYAIRPAASCAIDRRVARS